MSILGEILKKQTAAQAQKIVRLVLNDKALLEELMDCFFSDDLRLCQTASWAVGIIAQKEETLLLPYVGKMLDNLAHPKHNAILRNTMRAWQYMTIPEQFEGQVYEQCFNYISSPSEAIAVRAFSMNICYNIAVKYAELMPELKLQLQQCMLEEAPGVVGRARQLLRVI